MRQAMKQQKQALKYANQRARIALFMEMRLGKTMVSIRWAEKARLKRKLVISPKPVLNSWVDELQKERYPDEEIKILPLDTTNRLNYVKHYKTSEGWFLTNPASIVYCPEILKQNWDCVIVDESRMLSNPQADITKILVNNSDSIRYRAILSGCPAPESEQNYCEQFRFLHNKRFMRQNNFWWWRKIYYVQSGYDWVPRSGTIRLIREEIAQHAFVLTAKEAGIGNKKIYQKRIIECNDAQKKLSKQIKKDFEYTDKDGKFIMSKFPIVNLGWLQQIAGGFTPKEEFICINKIKEVCDMLKTDLKNKSAVIWFKHTHEIINCLHYLKRKNISCSYLMGKDSNGEKEFKAGKRQVMLAQAKCGQYGLDWSIASVAIYYSNWWSNEIRRQTEKRIEHPKKKEPLLYIDMLSEDTIDIDVHKVLGQKNQTERAFTNALIKSWRLNNGL